MKTFIKYISIVLLFLVIIICIWLLPEILVKENAINKSQDKDLLLVINEYRKLFVQILGGIILIYGLYLTYRRIRAMENNVLVSTESQITERFSKAVEHLGNDKLEIRLGGIYALERIASDSLKDHFSIMEILTAFVRENAKLEDNEKLRPSVEKSEKEQVDELISFESKKPAVDIEAVLTVIGRRKWIEEEKKNNFKLNLSLTDLEGAYLCYGNFENTEFWKSNLKKSNLNLANFSGSVLMRANLEGSFVHKTNFTNTNLRKSNLLDCSNLTVNQLLSSETVYLAELHESLKKNLKSRNPKLLEDNEI